MRIFVVDDDEMIREMLSSHLAKNLRYEIHVFSTGEDCLGNLHLNPDVVILDFELNTVIPDAEDGLHILQRIKNENEQICVIMLSSQTHYGKATQTIIKGAIQYVIKDDNAFGNIDKILKSLD